MKGHNRIRRCGRDADVAFARYGNMPMTEPGRPGAAFPCRLPISRPALAAVEVAGERTFGSDPLPGPGRKRARVPGRAGHPTDA